MKKILIILFLFLPLHIFAQSFTASVDETTVSETQRFKVTFTFSGKDINRVRNFKPPPFRNFMVLSGPNQSTSIQIINGVQSASLSYNYIIQPKKIGTFSIGTAYIEYNGESFKTKSIKISVVRGSSKPKKQKQDSGVSDEEIAKESLFG